MTLKNSPRNWGFGALQSRTAPVLRFDTLDLRELPGASSVHELSAEIIVRARVALCPNRERQGTSRRIAVQLRCTEIDLWNC